MNVSLRHRGFQVFRLLRSCVLVTCVVLSSPLHPVRAGSLLILGKFNEKPTILTLDHYEKDKGGFAWSTSECLPTKHNSGLTKTGDGLSAVGEWRRIGKQLQLAKIGYLAESPSAAADILEWNGSGLTVEKQSGNFVGASSTTFDTSIAILPGCDDSTENPGFVGVLLKPGLEGSARSYIHAQKWEITNLSMNRVGGQAKNALLIKVPVGSEGRVIEQLKRSGTVFDAARDYLYQTYPGLGWVLLPHEHLSGPSVSALQTELEYVLENAWPDQGSKLHLIPQQGNVFDITFLGPLSLFTDNPKLPGFWINTKLELLVDPVEKGNRLLVGVRDARLIRWPENGKGEPPNGFGTKLDCDPDGESNNMKSVIAIANRLLNTASHLYQGRDLTAPRC
jgi:hypothetical protein